MPGEYTFYGRYVAWTAADNREPLATNFAVRYINGGAFNGGTDLLVWRDSKVNQGAFTCPATLPAWYPLGQEAIVIFDEQENPERARDASRSRRSRRVEAIMPFPAEASRTEVGGAALPVTVRLRLAVPQPEHDGAAAGSNPPEDPGSLLRLG